MYYGDKMSREKPQKKYETEVTQFGNGAKIKAYKHHIGKKVMVEIIDDTTKEKNNANRWNHEVNENGHKRKILSR